MPTIPKVKSKKNKKGKNKNKKKGKRSNYWERKYRKLLKKFPFIINNNNNNNASGGGGGAGGGGGGGGSSSKHGGDHVPHHVPHPFPPPYSYYGGSGPGGGAPPPAPKPKPKPRRMLLNLPNTKSTPRSSNVTMSDYKPPPAPPPAPMAISRPKKGLNIKMKKPKPKPMDVVVSDYKPPPAPPGSGVVLLSDPTLSSKALKEDYVFTGSDKPDRPDRPGGAASTRSGQHKPKLSPYDIVPKRVPPNINLYEPKKRSTGHLDTMASFPRGPPPGPPGGGGLYVGSEKIKSYYGKNNPAVKLFANPSGNPVFGAYATNKPPPPPPPPPTAPIVGIKEKVIKKKHRVKVPVQNTPARVFNTNKPLEIPQATVPAFVPNPAVLATAPEKPIIDQQQLADAQQYIGQFMLNVINEHERLKNEDAAMVAATEAAMEQHRKQKEEDAAMEAAMDPVMEDQYNVEDELSMEAGERQRAEELQAQEDAIANEMGVGVPIPNVTDIRYQAERLARKARAEQQRREWMKNEYTKARVFALKRMEETLARQELRRRDEMYKHRAPVLIPNDDVRVADPRYVEQLIEEKQFPSLDGEVDLSTLPPIDPVEHLVPFSVGREHHHEKPVSVSVNVIPNDNNDEEENNYEYKSFLGAYK